MGLRGDAIFDGGITARTMAVGSITAGNAAIASAAIQSLNIQGGAVTATATSSRSDYIYGATAYQTVVATTLVMDTTGLSGQEVTVLASASCGYVKSNSSPAQWDARLFIQSHYADSRGGTGDRADTGVNLTGTHTFIASGGVETFYVELQVYHSSNMYVADRTIWAHGAKR